MTTLTASMLAERHRYLAHARPAWSSSMAAIRNQGGPWWCASCDTASYLIYRCSVCGRDLTSDTASSGRQ